MKIAIVGALDSELSLLSRALSQKSEHPLGGTTAWTGRMGSHNVALVKLSVGKVNAASRTQAIIDDFCPDLVINTGIAGSLQKEVHVLDVVLSESCVYHDFDARIQEKFFPFRSRFIADEPIVQKAQATAAAIGMTHHVGTIATGDLFVSDRETKHRIAEQTGALCVEMEGAAVAHTAFINQIPFLVIRTISDNADDQAEMDYDTFEQKAADQSAQFVEQLLQHIE